jgi:hypothetical protein
VLNVHKAGAVYDHRLYVAAGVEAVDEEEEGDHAEEREADDEGDHRDATHLDEPSLRMGRDDHGIDGVTSSHLNSVSRPSPCVPCHDAGPPSADQSYISSHSP